MIKVLCRNHILVFPSTKHGLKKSKGTKTKSFVFVESLLKGRFLTASRGAVLNNKIFLEVLVRGRNNSEFTKGWFSLATESVWEWLRESESETESES